MNPAHGPWTKKELRLLDKLTTPYAIQSFLDRIEYSADPIYRSPRRVLRDRKAHCVDGAFFAAAALRRLGHPPLVMELKAVRDDDHLLALFRMNGRLGAVAKSNFTALRYREPVYRTLRELVLSCFEGYFNLDGEKTLRSYSAPMNLARFDRLRWTTEDEGIEPIIERIDSSRHYPVLTDAMIAALQRIDDRSYRAALHGAKKEGLYVPKPEGKRS